MSRFAQVADRPVVIISLEGLPFDDESFDFIHLRFVGLGIPETAWENLLDECARVLKRGTSILEVSISYLVPPASYEEN